MALIVESHSLVTRLPNSKAIFKLTAVSARLTYRDSGGLSRHPACCPHGCGLLACVVVQAGQAARSHLRRPVQLAILLPLASACKPAKYNIRRTKAVSSGVLRGEKVRT